MPEIDGVAAWTIAGCAGGLLLITVAPFIRTGAWWIRAWDYPRVQVFFLSLIVLGASVAAMLLEGIGVVLGGGAIASVVAAGVQGAFIMPYTRLKHTRLPDATGPTTRLMVVNLDKRNDKKQALSRKIEEQDADILVLLEIDEQWLSALGRIERSYPHRLDVIRGDGLGISLWSRFEIEREQVRHLVSEDRASLHGVLHIGDKRLRFAGVHPAPPGLPKEDRPGRYDSRIRDAELVLLAREVADSRGDAWMVAGDFNDVAWSHTTRLFQRTSGLLDPRIGRGMFGTYHARYPLLRYPLDHVFVSGEIGIGSLRRVRMPGSDHFGVLVEFSIADGKRACEPEPVADDQQDSDQLVEEGIEDAQENDELPADGSAGA